MGLQRTHSGRWRICGPLTSPPIRHGEGSSSTQEQRQMGEKSWYELLRSFGGGRRTRSAWESADFLTINQWGAEPSAPRTRESGRLPPKPGFRSATLSVCAERDEEAQPISAREHRAILENILPNLSGAIFQPPMGQSRQASFYRRGWPPEATVLCEGDLGKKKIV